jgi:hypothetical protein
MPVPCVLSMLILCVTSSSSREELEAVLRKFMNELKTEREHTKMEDGWPARTELDSSTFVRRSTWSANKGRKTTAGANKSCSCASCFLNKINGKNGIVQSLACTFLSMTNEYAK